MSATPQSGNSTLRWVFLGLAFIVLIIIINSGINSCKRNNSEGDETTTDNSSSDKKPTFTTHITPCEWTENGEFYLESDDPIAQKFPSIPQIITYSGKGQSEVPYGRKKGPIKFWDPNDPINGRKKFRIYPVM